MSNSGKELVKRTPSEIVGKEKKGGTLLESKYRQFLEAPDDYSDMYFSAEEAQFIRGRLTYLSTGSFAAIPLMCSGPERCPFSQNCPYCQIGKPPLNRACLVERNLLKQWVIELLREYEVDVESVTDRFLVQEMAEIELLLYRINSNLAQPEYAEMVKDSYANVDRQGNPVYEEKVIPLMELKLKLQGRRDKLVKLMVGDRQEKKKMQALLKEKDEGDISTRGASLRRELERLQRETAKLSDKMTAEEGRIIEVIPIEEEKRLEEEEKQKRLEEIQEREEEKEKGKEGLSREDIFSAIDELEEENEE